MVSQYELLYIIPTTFTDEEVGSVETKVAGLVAKVGATVESTRRLGKFRLAYPIKKQRHGHYVMVLFAGEGSTVAKLDEQLRITPEVLRHFILQAEEGGAEVKFDLVQFNEVVFEGRDDRARRRDNKEAPKVETKDEIKEGVAAMAEKKEEKTEAVKPAASNLSSEELESKIETALSEDVKNV